MPTQAKDEDAKKLLNLLTAAQLAVYAAVYEREVGGDSTRGGVKSCNRAVGSSRAPPPPLIARPPTHASRVSPQTFVGTMHNDDEVDGALLGPALGHASAAMSVGLSAWALAEALSKKAKPAL